MHSLLTFSTQALRAFSASGAVLGALGLASASGCGGEENPYKPQPAWSGTAASLPAPPGLPSMPIKAGSDYTVYGAIHQLRSLLHSKDVTGPAEISIVGFIVDSNIPRAPDCAVHKTGKKDPENCSPEVPSFWIADEKGNAKGQKVRVVGWARNFAVVYDALVAYKKVKPGDQPKEPVQDDMLNVALPYPLPAVGAKVRVTGSYNVGKNVVSEMVAEPLGGVMALKKMDVLEPAPESAKFAKNNP